MTRNVGDHLFEEEQCVPPHVRGNFPAEFIVARRSEFHAPAPVFEHGEGRLAHAEHQIGQRIFARIHRPDDVGHARPQRACTLGDPIEQFDVTRRLLPLRDFAQNRDLRESCPQVVVQVRRQSCAHPH
jgi:hypothetical protein